MLCVIFGGSACAFNESLNGNSTHPIQSSITPSLARNSLTERLKLRTIAGEAHSSKRKSEREKRTLCANTSTRRVHEDGTGSPMRFNGLFYCSYSFTSACTTRASHTNVLRSRARFFLSENSLSLHNLTNDFWLSQIFVTLSLSRTPPHTAHISLRIWQFNFMLFFQIVIFLSPRKIKTNFTTECLCVKICYATASKFH